MRKIEFTIAMGDEETSWTEHGSASVTRRGKHVPHDFFPCHTEQIGSKKKYPLLFEDVAQFNASNSKPWRGKFQMKSVDTKKLLDIDINVFAEACKVMTNDIRGQMTDSTLYDFKDMVRPYFQTDRNANNFKGLLPVPITTP